MGAKVQVTIGAKDTTGPVMSKFQTRMKTLRKASALAATGIGGVTVAVGALTLGLKKAFLDPYSEQQKAVESLRASLLATGKDGTEALSLITKEAARLQTMTEVGDEAMIQAAATMTQLAPALNPPEIAQAQQAIVALAEVTGGNLQSAAQLLGKTLGSSTNALSRYGISVETNATASEKLAAIMGNQSLGAAFESAQAKAKSLDGRLTQLKNGFGDLLEVFGEIIEKSLNLGETSRSLTEWLARLTAKIEAQKDEWIKWGAIIVTAVKVGTQGFLQYLRIWVNVFDIIRHAATASFQLVLAAWMSAANGIGDGINLIIEGLNHIPGVDIAFRFGNLPADRFFEMASSNLQAIKKDVGDIMDAGRSIGASRLEGLQRIVGLYRGDITPGSQNQSLPGTGNTGLAGGGGGLSLGKRSATGLSVPEREIEKPFEGIRTKIKETATMAKIELSRAQSFAVDFAGGFADTLVQATESGIGAFRNFADQVIKQLLRIAAKFAVFKVLGAVLGPANPIVAAFGQGTGFRAHGGPVVSGRPFIVGERGPEMFVPNQDGRVVPNHQLSSAGGGDTVLNVTFVTPDGRTIDNQRYRISRNEKRGVKVRLPAFS